MTGAIHTDSQQVVGLNQAGAGAGAAAGATGSYRGENLAQVPSTASILEAAFKDSLEERTAALGEHQEKELSRRSISSGSKVDQMERILKLQKINKLLDSLADLDKQKLAKLLAQLAGDPSASSRQIRERLRQTFREPAHQYVALEALVEALKQDNAHPEQLRTAEAALAGLLAEHGDEIRAGINVSEAALEAARSGLGSPQDLRDSYRDAVLDYGGLPQTLAALREKYPPEKLPEAIHFMLKALGNDLAASGSSIDKARLNAILEDMYRLKLMAGMIERSNTLMQRTLPPGSAGDQRQLARRGADLLGEVLALQENKWINPEQIAPLPAKMGIRDTARQINFLNGFKELVRSMPEKAFADGEQAERMKDAVQLCLDEAIDREEEEQEL